METIVLFKKLYEFLGYATTGKKSLGDEMSVILQTVGRAQYQAARRAFADGQIDAAIACLYSSHELFYADANRDSLLRSIKLGVTDWFELTNPVVEAWRMSCETALMLATCFKLQAKLDKSKQSLVEKYKKIAIQCFEKYDEERTSSSTRRESGYHYADLGAPYHADPEVRKELNQEKKYLMLVCGRL
jgi:hypothetical protein